jgi:antitoxin StbD
MGHALFAATAASISELKLNPMKVVASGHGLPVVVLNRNAPAFYCVPASAYEAMMNRLDDIDLLSLVAERMQETSVKVRIDDL